MRAALVTEQDGTRSLTLQEVPDPVPGAEEILVRVRAAGLNRADLMLNPNHRPSAAPQAHPIAGQEFAGEVAAIGPGVSRWSVGDRVMGMTAGAYADYCKLDQRLAMPVPVEMDWDRAATLPVALQTMHDALVTHGGLQPGQSVLIHGAASGVGIVGLQIARLRGAAQIFGSSRSTGRLAALAAFGMDHGVDTTDPAWPEAVLAATGGRGVDLVVDMVSGPLVQGSMQATAVCGRIVNVGRLGGRTAAFDFNLHALRRLTYTGVTFRTRSDSEVAAIVEAVIADLWPDVEAGRIAVPIAARFALAELDAAQALMRSDRHLGKIVVTP